MVTLFTWLEILGSLGNTPRRRNSAPHYASWLPCPPTVRLPRSLECDSRLGIIMAMIAASTASPSFIPVLSMSSWSRAAAFGEIQAPTFTLSFGGRPRPLFSLGFIGKILHETEEKFFIYCIHLIILHLVIRVAAVSPLPPPPGEKKRKRPRLCRPTPPYSSLLAPSRGLEKEPRLILLDNRSSKVPTPIYGGSMNQTTATAAPGTTRILDAPGAAEECTVEMAPPDRRPREPALPLITDTAGRPVSAHFDDLLSSRFRRRFNASSTIAVLLCPRLFEACSSQSTSSTDSLK